jgi:hypothetical protein
VHGRGAPLRLHETCLRRRRVAAVERFGGAQPGGGARQGAGLEGLLGLAQRLLAERPAPLGGEPLCGPRQFGIALYNGAAGHGGVVGRQRIALAGGEAVVAQDVAGGGDDGVEGAAREQYRVDDGEQVGAEAERADGVVDESGAAIVPVVGEQPARPLGVVGGLQREREPSQIALLSSIRAASAAAGGAVGRIATASSRASSCRPVGGRSAAARGVEAGDRLPARRSAPRPGRKSRPPRPGGIVASDASVEVVRQRIGAARGRASASASDQQKPCGSHR